MSNVEPGPELRTRLAGASWPADVVVLWPDCPDPDVDLKVPPAWPGLNAALQWCAARAALIPFPSLAPQTLVLKLAGLVQQVAAGYLGHAISGAQISEFLEQLVVQLQDFPEPPAHTLPLGLGAHGDAGPRPYRVGFAPGEQLLLYTDGVTEARDEHGHFYPLAERVDLLKDSDAHAALDALRRDVRGHAEGPPHDDAAMLLLRYRGHGSGRGTRVPR